VRKHRRDAWEGAKTHQELYQVSTSCSRSDGGRKGGGTDLQLLPDGRCLRMGIDRARGRDGSDGVEVNVIVVVIPVVAGEQYAKQPTAGNPCVSKVRR
jgi:hypothetical protein